jgi:hypothetical protein
MRVNSFFGFFCQSLVIAREVQHHVPRQLVLHSFRLSADFFGAFPPNLGISPGSSHHRDSLLGHFTVAVAHSRRCAKCVRSFMPHPRVEVDISMGSA